MLSILQFKKFLWVAFPSSPLNVLLWIMFFIANIMFSHFCLRCFFLIQLFLGCSIMSSMQRLLMGFLKHFLLLPVLDFDCWASLCHFFCYTLFLNYFNFSPLSVRFKTKVSKNSWRRHAYMNVTCWLVSNIIVYVGNPFTQEPINASIHR